MHDTFIDFATMKFSNGTDSFEDLAAVIVSSRHFSASSNFFLLVIVDFKISSLVT